MLTIPVGKEIGGKEGRGGKEMAGEGLGNNGAEMVKEGREPVTETVRVQSV